MLPTAIWLSSNQSQKLACALRDKEQRLTNCDPHVNLQLLIQPKQRTINCWSLHLTLPDNRAFAIRIALVRNNICTTCCSIVVRYVVYVVRLGDDDVVSKVAAV
jgi:hypothetical protein